MWIYNISSLTVLPGWLWRNVTNYEDICNKAKVKLIIAKQFWHLYSLSCDHTWRHTNSVRENRNINIWRKSLLGWSVCIRMMSLCNVAIALSYILSIWTSILSVNSNPNTKHVPQVFISSVKGFGRHLLHCLGHITFHGSFTLQEALVRIMKLLAFVLLAIIAGEFCSFIFPFWFSVSVFIPDTEYDNVIYQVGFYLFIFHWWPSGYSRRLSDMKCTVMIWRSWVQAPTGLNEVRGTSVLSHTLTNIFILSFFFFLFHKTKDKGCRSVVNMRTLCSIHHGLVNVGSKMHYDLGVGSGCKLIISKRELNNLFINSGHNGEYQHAREESHRVDRNYRK